MDYAGRGEHETRRVRAGVIVADLIAPGGKSAMAHVDPLASTPSTPARLGAAAWLDIAWASSDPRCEGSDPRRPNNLNLLS